MFLRRSARRVEPRVAAAGELTLGQEGGQALGLAAHRAQHVEAHDVARALPDAVQRRVAQQLRQRALLDVAVAAEALEGLGHHRGRALAHPELAERHAYAGELGLAGVDGVGEAQPQDGGRLGLESEVGEHVAHERLVDEQSPEGLAVARVVQGARDGVTHRRGRAGGVGRYGAVDCSRRDPARARRRARHHLRCAADAAGFTYHAPDSAPAQGRGAGFDRCRSRRSDPLRLVQPSADSRTRRCSRAPPSWTRRSSTKCCRTSTA